MNLLKELLLELNAQQQAEIEAERDLSDAGVADVRSKNKALLLKKAKEKQKQITSLSRSDDPIDRQIMALRQRIAQLIAKKQQQAQAKAKATT